MSQVLGIIDIYFKGQKIPAEKGATFNPGGLSNSPVIVGQQVHRSQQMNASMAKLTTVLQAGQSLTALLDRSEGELQVKCDTGQVFVVPDAFLSNSPDVTGGDGGKIQLEYAGSAGQEIS